MAVTLCFDFGNTRLKCAVFENADMKELLVLENDDETTIENLLNRYRPAATILSSVIDHNKKTETVLQQHGHFHLLNKESKLPFTLVVSKPETVGADRLALCAAAVHLYPGRHNLVIGLGTCITYNFINKFSEFLGGGISPGMEMRFKAMHEFTALLPMVQANWNFPLIGYDTRTNLLSGVILGMSKEIDGMIDEYASKYSNFNVVLTGGDMGFFASLLKKKIFADPDLIYKGLYAISKTNL